MRFGFMLRTDIFFGDIKSHSLELCNSFGGRDDLLNYLGKNIDTIELHTITNKMSPEDILNSVKLIHSHNLSVTFHGQLKEDDTPSDFFSPYTLLFNSGIQKTFNITLHPLNNKEDTIKILKSLCDYADELGYPATFTLENQRYKHDIMEYNINGNCKTVGEIVTSINSKRLKTCFDFGHFLSNKKTHTDMDIMTDEFLNNINHTHIHSFYEGKTHFPLGYGETELENNINILLENHYTGVLSLEISFGRFQGQINFKDALTHSISILKTAYKQTLRKIKYVSIYKNEYEKKINNILRACHEKECLVGQLVSAAYLVKFGDTKIIIDPSLIRINVTRQGRRELLNLIKSCDAVIITHKHHDHFDKQLIRELSRYDIKWFIPNFFTADDLKECNLIKENITFTQKDTQYSLNNININIFESIHSHQQDTISEYGFSLEYNNKNYVFVADVRTYSPEKYKKFENTECLFAHLWLGRANALNIHSNNYIESFCNFVNYFSAKKIYIAHVFDVRRSILDMWSDIHYNIIKENVDNITLFTLGDWHEL